MGKPKMLGYNKPCKSGSAHHAKAPWQGAKKKQKREDNPVKLIFFDEFETDPERTKQGGVCNAAKQSKTGAP